MKLNKIIVVGLITSCLLLTSCGNKGGDPDDGKSETPENLWSAPTYTWTADYSTCTAKRVRIDDPTQEQTETTQSTYTVKSPAGCEIDGEGLYTVNFENKAFSTQIVSVPIEPIGHQWGEPTYEWSDDYSKCTASRVCLRDSSHIDSETVDSTYKVVHEPGCYVEGDGRYEAMFSKPTIFVYQYKDVKIPAIGHHEWLEPTYRWSDDYSTCTASRACKHGNHPEEETRESNFEVLTKETVETDGEGKYTVSFTNPVFESQEKIVTINRDKYAQNPHLSADGKTVKYGLYPQTAITDDDLEDELDSILPINPTKCGDLNYYRYEGEYYTFVKATPYEDNYCFDDGTSIKNKAYWWFKCEPITWKVLSDENGEYLLVSDLLLGTYRYNEKYTDIESHDNKYPNNYKVSEIRNYLNDKFFKAAFTISISEYVKSTEVDNSESTTGVVPNDKTCENTQDKVFLLSYQDYTNADYGFTSIESREAKTTDFARAAGARIWTVDDYKNNGNYWSRSPSGESNVQHVRGDGEIALTQCGANEFCFRPAITITL